MDLRRRGTRATGGRLQRALSLLFCCFGMVLVHGGTEVVACGIDGIPSMTINQRLVTLNHEQATKENLAYWAPFLLGAARANAELRLTEDAAKLHRALSDQAFATPFRWDFGDGAAARGLSVSHLYHAPGWYKVDVSYYYTPQRRWVVFDSAQLRIPGAATGHHTGIFSAQLALPVGGLALGLGALALARLNPWRRAQRARSGERARQRARAGRRNLAK